MIIYELLCDYHILVLILFQYTLGIQENLSMNNLIQIFLQNTHCFIAGDYNARNRRWHCHSAASRNRRNTTIRRNLGATSLKKVCQLSKFFYKIFYNIPNQIVLELPDYKGSGPDNPKHTKNALLIDG